MYTIIGGDGREYGPVSAEQIRQWIAAGRANGQSRAKVFGTEEWKSLDEFADFAPRAAEPPPLSGGSFEFASAVESGPPLASRWLRLAAALIDIFISGFAAIPAFMPLGRAMVDTAFQNAVRDRDWATLLAAPGMMTGLSISGFIVFVLLVVNVCLLSLRGQTLGKMLVRVRIVKFEDGTNAGFVRAVLLRAVVMGIFEAIPYLGSLLSLVDVLFIFQDNRRCLHDLLAKTKVVAVV